MMGDDRDEPNKPGRPCLSRTEAPVGIYNGEHAIIVYQLRPIPLWPKYWMQALAKQFHRELDPAPKIDIALTDDCIRFSVFVSNEVSVADLCKLDDAVHNAVDNAGRAIELEQTALNEKLDQVRKRRIEAAGD
jgi:hypothetical protein